MLLPLLSSPNPSLFIWNFQQPLLTLFHAGTFAAIGDQILLPVLVNKFPQLPECNLKMWRYAHGTSSFAGLLMNSIFRPHISFSLCQHYLSRVPTNLHTHGKRQSFWAYTLQLYLNIWSIWIFYSQWNMNLPFSLTLPKKQAIGFIKISQFPQQINMSIFIKH